jgi:hypothetical protein
MNTALARGRKFGVPGFQDGRQGVPERHLGPKLNGRGRYAPVDLAVRGLPGAIATR